MSESSGKENSVVNGSKTMYAFLRGRAAICSGSIKMKKKITCLETVSVNRSLL